MAAAPSSSGSGSNRGRPQNLALVLPSLPTISVTSDFLNAVWEMTGSLAAESRALEDVRALNPAEWFLANNQVLWEGLSNPHHLSTTAEELLHFVRSYFSVTEEEEENALYMPQVGESRDLFDMIRSAVSVNEQTQLFSKAFETEMLRKRQQTEQQRVKRPDVGIEVTLTAE